MAKRKICVVITARPSYSRVKTALQAISRHADLDLKLVVAASALLDKYGNAINIIKQDGFKVDGQVHMSLEGENLVASTISTGLGLIELATVFNNLKPDIVMTIADRYETLATAIAASYQNIPLAHLQGGEVTGSIDEKVRHAITKLADIHLTSNPAAAERVVRLGERPESVFVTGCPSIDLAYSVKQEGLYSFDPFENYNYVGKQVNLTNGFLVVLQHPVTTEYDMARQHIMRTLEAVSEIGMPALWFWPNIDAGSDGVTKGIRAFRENNNNSEIAFFKNLGPEDFIRLIGDCSCLVGNSSVALREAAFLGVPAVNIGNRQTGRDRGKNVMDVGYQTEEIIRAVKEQIKHGKYETDEIYGNGRSGERVADLLAQVELTVEKRLTY